MFKVNNKDTKTPCSSVSIVNCEHVIAGWVYLVFLVLRLQPTTLLKVLLPSF